MDFYWQDSISWLIDCGKGIKMQICCFIGHRKIQDEAELRERLHKTVVSLIEAGAREFIFGDHSQFDDLCHDVVTELKTEHPGIRRIKYRSNYPGELSEYEKPFFLEGYEENICPAGVAGAGRISYVKRNQAMVVASDVCIFYYDEGYQPSRRKASKWPPAGDRPNSGTRLAFEFAVRKHKEIINLYDAAVQKQKLYHQFGKKY